MYELMIILLIGIDQIVSMLNILAVAIQLNDHAKKAESPILQYQAQELD